MTKLSPRLAFGLKLVVTAGLLAWLVRKVDIAPVLLQLRTMNPRAAAAGALVLLVQQAMLGVRWQWVSRIVGAPLGAASAFRLTLIGHFFNQVVPSGLAGDAARAWVATRDGAPLGPTVRAIVCDRVIGLIALIVIIAVTVFLLPAATADRLPAKGWLQAISLATLIGLVVFRVCGESIARTLARLRAGASLGQLVRDLLRTSRAGATSTFILALAVAVQVLNVVVVALCAAGMSVPLDFGAAWIVIPTVMLVSMAPVSFAGWGVREGAMVFGLGLLGFAPQAALAVSVAYGLLLMLLGVPGAVLWLVRRDVADRAATR